jgi:hypothetical protein
VPKPGTSVPAYALRENARGRSRYRIGETGVNAPADLVVVAISPARGLGRIRVNGTPWTASETARNLLVAIDPTDGLVIAREAFAEATPTTLERLLRELPDGAIVCVALAEVSQPEAVARLLRHIGGREGQVFSGAYAMIGVKGAAPGAATSVSNPRRALRRVGTDRLRAHVTSFDMSDRR